MTIALGCPIVSGQSTRFGDADKALEPLEGTPMIKRVATRLASVTDQLVVNCRKDYADGIRAVLEGRTGPTSIAVDPVPNKGSVAGAQRLPPR